MTPEPAVWTAAPDSPPAPCGGQVHVWRARVDISNIETRHLYESLSGPERERAAAFKFDKDQRRFIARRGLLRAVLARYLAMAPARVECVAGPHGKPSLARGDSGLEFNQSASGDLTLIAVASATPVGIDIERINVDPGHEELARRFFAPGEVAALCRLSPAERGIAFFRCWARKEAVVKALGMGLSFPLDRFEVPLEPGGGEVDLPSPGDAATKRWRLIDLQADPNYADALCGPLSIAGVERFDLR